MSASSSSAASHWNAKLKEAQDVASRATKAELGKRYSEAFQLYIRAGQLYLWLLGNTPSTDGATVVSSSSNSGLGLAVSRDKLKLTAQKVMARAEKIKASGHDLRPVERDMLSDEEQSNILARSSVINQLTFPPWSKAHETLAHATSTQWQDPDGLPLLAPAQLSQGAVYRHVRPSKHTHQLGLTHRLRGSDIVQDTVTDCSFVAALEVAVEHDDRFGTRLANSALFPKTSTASVNTKYNVRLVVNGIPRCITIDAQLPCYPPSEDQGTEQEDRLMCATSRKGLALWPALLEKAYLKVMGGYDFLGSNSSIDLYALTGWIPEQLFMRQAGFQREKAWSRVFAAWQKGENLITVGTGKTSARLEGTGLVSSHDYAVLVLLERGNRRYARLMNPWKTAHTERPAIAISHEEELTLSRIPSREESIDSSLSRLGMEDHVLDPTFVVTWDDLCSHFDSLYLNWDPTLFQHSLTIHSSWKQTLSPQGAVETGSSLGQNPQFRLCLPEGLESASSSSTSEIWLLLTKHYSPTSRSKDTGEELQEGGEYIAIHIFQQDSNAQHRLYHPHGAGSRRMGAYVDGTHNLVRFDPTPNPPATAQQQQQQQQLEYTVVVSRQYEPGRSTAQVQASADVHYTLSVYSPYRMQIHELPRAFPYRQIVEGAWTQRTAGGNVTHPTFLTNPQWTLTLPRARNGVSLLLMVECAKHIPVQLVLTYSPQGAGRVGALSEGDIVVSSGIYNYGLAVAQRNNLDTSASATEATYTLVVSTFDPATVGEFRLAIESSLPATLRAIPPEGAGMFRRTLTGTWTQGSTAGGSPGNLPRYLTNPSWIVSVPSKSSPTVILARLTLTGATSPSPYINLALFMYAAGSSQTHEGLGTEVASSGPYTDLVSGALLDRSAESASRSEDRRQKQDKIVLESATQYRLIASTYAPNIEANFRIEFYSQLLVDITPLSANP